MGQADIKPIVRAYLSAACEQEDIADDQDIFESGIVSSIFALELIGFVEEEFGITVEDDELDLENFKSLNALSAFISRKTPIATS